MSGTDMRILVGLNISDSTERIRADLDTIKPKLDGHLKIAVKLDTKSIQKELSDLQPKTSKTPVGTTGNTNAISEPYKVAQQELKKLYDLKMRYAKLSNVGNNDAMLYKKQIEAQQRIYEKAVPKDTSSKFNTEQANQLILKRIDLESKLQIQTERTAQAIIKKDKADIAASQKANAKIQNQNSPENMENFKQDQAIMLARMEQMKVTWSAMNSDPATMERWDTLHAKISKTTDPTQGRMLNKEIQLLSLNVGKAGLKQKSLFDSIGQTGARLLSYLASMISYTAIISGFRNAIRAVKDIDLAMTELKKVTDLTDVAYTKFLDNATNRAQKLGATISDVVMASADAAKLGLNIADAETLADTSIIYKNVADGISSIGEASESIISPMKAFNIEAENSMQIADKFNAVSNKFSITSRGIGEGMKNASSSLAAAGNSIDESLGLLVAANATIQDESIASQGLRAISMRLRNTAGALEELGEDSAGAATSITKLQTQLLNLTGGKVDIMLDNNNFKNTYQILTEISSVWDTLTDKAQADITRLVAGTNRSNVFSSIMLNMEDAFAATEVSMNSAGSAMEENEKVMDSVAGKSAKLSASFQKMSSTLIDTGLIKWLLDAANGLTNFISIGGGIPTTIALIIALTSAMSAFATTDTGIKLGSLFKKFGTGLKDLITLIPRTTSQIYVQQAAIAATANASGIATTKMQVFGNTLKGLGKALLSSPLFWIAVAAGAVKLASVINDQIVTLEEQRKKLKDVINEFNDLKNEQDSVQSKLKDTGLRIDELRSKGTLTIVEAEELDNLQKLNRELELTNTLLGLQKEQTLNNLSKEVDGMFEALIRPDKNAHNAKEFQWYDVLGFPYAFRQMQASVNDLKALGVNNLIDLIPALFNPEFPKTELEALLSNYDKLQRKINATSDPNKIKGFREEQQGISDSLIKQLNDWTLIRTQLEALPQRTSKQNHELQIANDVIGSIMGKLRPEEWNAMQIAENIEKLQDLGKTDVSLKGISERLFNPTLASKSAEEYRDIILGEIEKLPQEFKESLVKATSGMSDKEWHIQVAAKLGLDVNTDEFIKAIPEQIKKRIGKFSSSDFTISDFEVLVNPNFKFTGNGIDAAKKAIEDYLGTATPNLKLGDLDGISTHVSNLKLVSTALGEFSDNGVIASETLGKLKTDLDATDEQVVKLYNAFKSKNLKDVKQALSEIATEYIKRKIVTGELTEETKGLYAAELKQNGIANASAVIEQQLALSRANKAVETAVAAAAEGNLTSELIASSNAALKSAGALNAVAIATKILEINALATEINTLSESFGNLSGSALIAAKVMLAVKKVQLANSKEGLDDIQLPAVSVGVSAPKSGGKSEDSWKKAYDEEFAYLEYRRKMDLIDDQQYHDELLALNQKYFAGRAKYRKEDQDNQIKLYELQKTLAKDRLNDMQHEIDMMEERNKHEDNQSIVISNKEKQVAIYKRMQDEVHQQAEHYRKLGLSETSSEIQELVKLWWQYQSKMSDIFKAITEDYKKEFDEKLSIQRGFIDKLVALQDSKNTDLDRAILYDTKWDIIGDIQQINNDLLHESRVFQENINRENDGIRAAYAKLFSDKGLQQTISFDELFLVTGEINEGVVAHLKNFIRDALGEEGLIRLDELIYSGSGNNKFLHELREEQLKIRDSYKKIRDDLAADEKKAFDIVMDMIEKRKQRELENIEEIHKREMKYWEDRRKIIEDNYRRQLSLIDDLKNAEDYQRSLNKETDELSRIQLEIDKYAMIDTDAARTKVSELTKQLNDQQDKINEMQRNKEHEDLKRALEDDRDLLLDNIEKKVEAENEAYEEAKALLDQNYSDEKMHQEALEALRTKHLRIFYEKSKDTYGQIADAGQDSADTLETAYAEFYTSTGLLADKLVDEENFRLLNSFEEIRAKIVEMTNALEKFHAEDYGINGENFSSGVATKQQYTNGNTSAINNTLNTPSIYPAHPDERNKIATMKSNSMAWHSASTAKKADLSDENQRLGREIGATYRSASGTWEKNGLPLWHTGRIPSWLSKDEEQAIVRKDETILTKPVMQGLLSKINLFEKIASKMPNFMMKPQFSPALAGAGGNSIGDLIININGNADAKVIETAGRELLRKINNAQRTMY